MSRIESAKQATGIACAAVSADAYARRTSTAAPRGSSLSRNRRSHQARRW
ncbi:hypothetical protein LC55x_2327 [Lysobacter capsici]|nr:hypothetical protein LC55x_2327 [Lysobacter capsici]